MITLQEITKDNWKKCCRLKVSPEQENFVAPNWYTILQSHYEEGLVPLAAYDGDTPVGLVMYGYDKDEDSYWIIRLMVDHTQQRKGYGRAILRETLRRIKEQPDVKQIVISYMPDNEVARQLYLSEGFKENDELQEGEVVARMHL